MALTGLSRSALAQRIDALLGARLLRESGVSASTGGRPATRLAFDVDSRVVLAADIGATHARCAVTNLAARALAESDEEIAVSVGPEAELGRVAAAFTRLLREAGRTPADVCGIGLGVPGPVEFSTGRVSRPPIMPGWDGFPIREHLAELLASVPPVPVLVDNDVNIMALGEYRANWPEASSLVLVKVSTGIGAGIVLGGEVYRGHQGSAGDIGHIRVVGGDDALCGCGNAGCLGAVASGSSVARALRGLGVPADGAGDVVDLVRRAHPRAVALVREAGRLVGQVMAGLVSTLNPSVILLGGRLAQVHELFLSGVREVIHQRCPPLATRDLHIAESRLAQRAAVTGAAHMVVEHAFAADAVDAALAASAVR